MKALIALAAAALAAPATISAPGLAEPEPASDRLPKAFHAPAPVLFMPPVELVHPEPASAQRPDVVYVPTPQPVVEAMLQLAKVRKGDILYDLGSGDGRIPVTAARVYGIRAVGIDIDPRRIAEANANAREAGVTDRVTFKEADLFKSDISEASIVTLYLLESLNERLRPKLLAELEPGTRIVSHAFGMGDWEPEVTQEVNGRTIYLWIIPPHAQKPEKEQ